MCYHSWCHHSCQFQTWTRYLYWRKRFLSITTERPDTSANIYAQAKNGYKNRVRVNNFLKAVKTKSQKSVRPWSLNSSIVPVFWSLFEVSLQNISPFSNRIKPKIFETLSDATESNAQRNKLSLQATTSSGISHFRKTHLKRREVVMYRKYATRVPDEVAYGIYEWVSSQ